MHIEDEELIELAAKAIGITVVSKLMPNSDGTEAPEFFQLFDDGKVGTWNPLSDDGDAFRLAVKLQITVTPKYLYKSPWNDGGKLCDPYAATRKAITRAAAEIGRNMK